MNRSAYCIKMLVLLKARGFLTREELARLLACNVRNIPNYRKELEIAGYEIAITRGKYGGYQLKNDSLFPVVGMRKEEFQALVEATTYMGTHGDFLHFDDFQKAMDKIFATTSLRQQQNEFYIGTSNVPVSHTMKDFIQRIEQAKKDGIVVDILYKNMNAKDYQKVRIHPYEVLNDKGSYYCFAYSLKAKDYRNFKFSDERMKQITFTEYHFQRDENFKIKDHIGQMSLLKDDRYDLDLIVHKESALLLSEKVNGMDTNMTWIDEDTLHYQTTMEGKIPTIQFILSLGNQVEMLAPLDLKQEIVKIIEDMRTQYNSAS